MSDEMVRPELIHTQFLARKKKWTAFVTWRAYDLYELGDTEREAVYNLCTKHASFLGLSGDNAKDIATKVTALNSQ